MPLILDAYSCSGLYADGLVKAGWEVICLDNNHRALKHNPHETVLGDALELMKDKGFIKQFDAVHTSPPCQGYSASRNLADAQKRGRGRAVDLYGPTKHLLHKLLVPWTIENVERSPLRNVKHIKLCGSAFGLQVQRHRLFESNVILKGTDCNHKSFPLDPETNKPRPWGVYYMKGDRIPKGGRTVDTLEQGLEVMGIDRTLPWRYLCEGLPPAYGEFIGKQLLEIV